jgi:hypothetical protein
MESDEKELVAGAWERRPIPDPTVLTTQQLLRELTALKELVFTRLDGMDEATRLIQAQQVRVPTEVDRAVQNLRELLESRFVAFELRFEERNVEKLYDEKFHSIETQFKERDTRTEQTSKDSKVAVDAALQAAKEAVGEQNKSSALAIAKSEASTAKQIDQLQTLITTTSNNSDEKIADLKERLTRIEGMTGGSEAAKKNLHDNSSVYIALAALVVAIIVGAVSVMRPAPFEPVAVAPITNPR